MRFLHMRFGLSGGPGATLLAVGQFHGLTKERIRQIELRALSKLRCQSYGAADIARAHTVLLH
jgi:Sigma-70, region 4